MNQAVTQLCAEANGALKLQAMLVANLFEAIGSALGVDGREAMKDGLFEYGRWRGQRIASIVRAANRPADAEALIEFWPTADIALLLTDGRAHAEGSSGRVDLQVDESPEWSHWLDSQHSNVAEFYYHSVYPGIAAGYGSVAVEMASGPDLKSPWKVRWISTSGSKMPQAVVPSLSIDAASLTRLVRLTIQNYSALYALVAKELIRRFDTVGELTIRDSIRRQGRERGLGQRLRHQQMGLPINLKTLMDNFDVPVAAAWEWKDDGYLSAGTWHQECTWCPHIPVWKELDALPLGNIYDVEIHQSQFTAYHPDVRVQWETLQTRGSKTCRFRFSIPELQRADEPKFNGRLD